MVVIICGVEGGSDNGRSIFCIELVTADGGCGGGTDKTTKGLASGTWGGGIGINADTTYCEEA